MSQQQPAARPPRQQKPWQWIVGVVVVSLGIAALTGRLFDNSDEPTRAGAERICRQFVEKQLKAPSTADHLDASSILTLADGRYEVRAAVDAQNGFGAQIRTTYTCRVEWQQGDRWRLLSLDTDD